MFLRFRSVIALLGALPVLGLAALAHAQPGPTTPALPIAEIWGAILVTQPPEETTLNTHYVPAFTGQLVSGLGSQTLIVSGSGRAGFELGAAFYPAAHFGLEARLERFAPSLSGTSTPHDVAIIYLAKQPPAYELKQYSYQRATDWDDPVGTVSLTTISANAVLRAAVAPRVRITASGGLAIGRLGGTLDSVGYTVFSLGGHAVLFPDTAEIGLRFPTETRLGLNVGGGVDVVLGPRVALTAGWRWLLLGTAEPAAVARRVLNADEIPREIDIDDVRENLKVEGLSINLNRARVVVGLKLAW